MGGKISFIGVYSGAMNVHVPFPFIIPKFGFWIKYFEIPGSMKGDAKLLISLPGDKERPSIEADVQLDNLRANAPVSPSTLDDDTDSITWWQYQMPIVLAPLVLNGPGRIRVRMHFEKEIVRLGSIPVIEAQTPSTKSVPGET